MVVMCIRYYLKYYIYTVAYFILFSKDLYSDNITPVGDQWLYLWRSHWIIYSTDPEFDPVST